MVQIRLQHKGAGAFLPLHVAKGAAGAMHLVGVLLGFSEGFSLGLPLGFSEGFSLGLPLGFSEGFSVCLVFVLLRPRHERHLSLSRKKGHAS